LTLVLFTRIDAAFMNLIAAVKHVAPLASIRFAKWVVVISALMGRSGGLSS
jgi:hypothetical protein